MPYTLPCIPTLHSSTLTYSGLEEQDSLVQRAEDEIPIVTDEPGKTMLTR